MLGATDEETSKAQVPGATGCGGEVRLLRGQSGSPEPAGRDTPSLP